MNPTPSILEKLREEKGWTKTEVARRLGMKTVSTYANWEYGLRQPDNEMLVKIARLYGVSTDYLLGLEDSKVNTVFSLDHKIADFIKRFPNINLMFDGFDKMSDERKEEFIDRIIEQIEFDNYRENKKK